MPQDSIILQNDLNALQKWEKKWKMELYPDECKFLKITNKTRLISSKYHIHNTEIEGKKSAKYLGLTIDNNLRWKDQYINTNKKANQILNFIKRNMNKCPREIKAKC